MPERKLEQLPNLLPVALFQLFHRHLRPATWLQSAEHQKSHLQHLGKLAACLQSQCFQCWRGKHSRAGKNRLLRAVWHDAVACACSSLLLLYSPKNLRGRTQSNLHAQKHFRGLLAQWCRQPACLVFSSTACLRCCGLIAAASSCSSVRSTRRRFGSTTPRQTD